MPAAVWAVSSCESRPLPNEQRTDVRCRGGVGGCPGGALSDYEGEVALQTDLRVTVLNQRVEASRDADWIDPMIGARYTRALGEGGPWSFGLTGDIGGFGIGSDFTYLLTATVTRQVTDRLSWFAGYRLVGFDYEDGRGDQYQRYDLTEQGPGLGVARLLPPNWGPFAHLHLS